MSLSHIGNTRMFKDQSVSNVLFLPKFKFDLLSVTKITKELQCTVGFFLEFYVFQDLSTVQVKGIDKEEHGLYILNEGPPSTPKKMVNDSRAHSNSVKTESSNIWHKRLGHAPFDVIKKHDSFLFLSDNVLYPSMLNFLLL